MHAMILPVRVASREKELLIAFDAMHRYIPPSEKFAAMKTNSSSTFPGMSSKESSTDDFFAIEIQLAEKPQHYMID